MEDLNDKASNGNLANTEWNQVPTELQNPIEQTGQVLTAADLNQLGKAIASYVANSNFYADSGSANTHILTSIGSKQSIVDYVDGMAVEFLAADTNTGPTTVNVASKGVKPIVDAAGSALTGSEIISGERIKLKFRSGDDDFIIDANVPAASVLTGSIVTWPVIDIPSGYLECNGASLDTTEFSDLFIVLEYTYGGSTSNFNIPDLRGEFIRGFNNGEANDPDAGSRTDRGDGTTGDNVGTKQADEFESHTHGYAGSNFINAGDSSGGGAQNPTGLTTDSTGGSTETRPRNVYMMYIIKT